MSRLIRHKVPEFYAREGYTVSTKTVAGDELYDALLKKLQEEVNEFLAGKDVEELPDVLELIHNIAAVHNISPEDLAMRREKRAMEKGVYTAGVLLEKTEFITPLEVYHDTSSSDSSSVSLSTPSSALSSTSSSEGHTAQSASALQQSAQQLEVVPFEQHIEAAHAEISHTDSPSDSLSASPAHEVKYIELSSELQDIIFGAPDTIVDDVIIPVAPEIDTDTSLSVIDDARMPSSVNEVRPQMRPPSVEGVPSVTVPVDISQSSEEVVTPVRGKEKKSFLRGFW